jgi:hypothetical protein
MIRKSTNYAESSTFELTLLGGCDSILLAEVVEGLEEGEVKLIHPKLIILY